MADTYKIGEAAALLKLKTYVLRFWETEFPDIVPLRTEKGQRLYTEEHLALLERIRHLLHDRGLTIGGARKVLAEEKERGAVYTLGNSAKLPLPGDTASQGQGQPPYAGATQYAQSRQHAPSASFDGYYEQDEFGSSAWSRERDQNAARYRQFNLPGITPPPLSEKPTVFPEETDDSFEDGGLLGSESYAAASPAEDQRMLPLFSVATSLIRPEQMAGGNFIQAGSSSRPTAPPVTDINMREALEARDDALEQRDSAFGQRDDALKQRDDALGRLERQKRRSREELHGILDELNNIASLLRR